MSKFNVGDKVRIKDYKDPNGAMCAMMLDLFGGKVCTISKAQTERDFDGIPVDVYEIDEDCSTPNLKFGFLNEDIECLVERAFPEISEFGKPQRIEVPVKGGRLVAVANGGGGYPSIGINFVASGDAVEYGLCFAEVCALETPRVIRVGTFEKDGDNVKDIFEYPMWKKEEA